MTRVWLTEWEWACCGEPFAVGDEVDFGIERRGAGPALAEALGSELAATVDGMESHHVEEFPDRVRGRVIAVHTVTGDVVETRVLRRPGRGAPPDATMPADGEEWPAQGRDLGNGVWVDTRPTRFVVEASPVADSARLHEAAGVRLPSEEAEPVLDLDDPPLERRVARRSGWLVDVEEI